MFQSSLNLRHMPKRPALTTSLSYLHSPTAAEVLYDSCQRQSLSRSPNNISAVMMASLINRTESPAPLSLDSPASCQSVRLRERRGGSGGRWEVTGEQSQWMVEWRCDVSLGTSMTHDSSEGWRGHMESEVRKREFQLETQPFSSSCNHFYTSCHWLTTVQFSSIQSDFQLLLCQGRALRLCCSSGESLSQ